MKMADKITILLDTNVVIQLEEPSLEGIIEPDFRKLSKQIQSHSSIKVFYHPCSKNDIGNDKDQRRKVETLSRLDKYHQLLSPPLENKSVLENHFGRIEKTNDEIDCQILFALKKNCVNYLITNDKRIHKRAREAKLHTRVFTTKEITELIDTLFKSNDLSYPNVKDEFLYNIKIEDPIFDSIKTDYKIFDEWFKQKCREQRKCYLIYSNDNKIAAICIYSINELPEIDIISPPAMKLCTFKVAIESEGKKYGELLLKLALLRAHQENVATLWITCKEKHDILIDLLEEFGFYKLNDRKDDDLVLVKKMVPEDKNPLLPVEYHIKFSPHFLDANLKKYIIPIKNCYLKALFPEFGNQIDGSSLDIPGNTIKKVYLSHSNITPLSEGSLIFFYETYPNKCIQIMGIIENSKRVDNLSELLSIIGKRSVYSLEELKKMIEKRVLILEFRQILRKFNKIDYNTLISQNIINGSPQSIMQIKDDKYLLLKSILF